MRRYTAIFLAFLMIVFLASCSTTSGTTGGSQSLGDARVSALGAIGRMETAFSGPMYEEGSGGEGKRIAILAPEIQGDVPDYLPSYIQGVLGKNFDRFSAMTIVEREFLNRLLAEKDLAASGRFSEENFLSWGNIANADYLLFGTIQRLSGDRYSLRFVINDQHGNRKGSFVENGTLIQVDERNGILINQASDELLTQIGVRLTETGRRVLLMGNAASASAEAGFARAVIAQADGDSVQAMLYFSQAAAFDPSQIEALARLSTLATTIREGTVTGRTVTGEILHDREQMLRWLEVFKETARFFNEYPPFEITFDPNLIQEGESNLTSRDPAKHTANLAMRIALDPSQTAFDALNTLLEGLEKTGRRDPWGFSGWPLLNIAQRDPGTVVFRGQRSFSFKVDIALVNENRKTIAARSITLKTGTLRFSAGDTVVPPPSGEAGIIRFPNMRIDDLTDTVTIVINSVRLVSTSNRNVTGNMKIATGDLAERERVEIARIERERAERELAEIARRPLDPAIAALEAEQLARLNRGSGGAVAGRIATAYDNLVAREGDNARLFKVIGISTLTNIFGQMISGVKVVKIEMDGVNGYDSRTDAVFIVGSEGPAFFRIKEGSTVLLPVPKNDLQVRDVATASFLGENTTGRSPSNSLADVFVSNVQFKPTASYFVNDSALAALDKKATIVFRFANREAGVMQMYPTAYRTRSTSLDRNSILADLRLGGSNAIDGNVCIFDLANNDEWFNYINISHILAIDGIPIDYMQPTEEVIRARSRYRQQIVNNRNRLLNHR